MRDMATLQSDLEQRIYEGAIARVVRYFTDRKIRKHLVVARAAQKEVNREEGKP